MTLLHALFPWLFGASTGGGIAHPERLALSGAVRAAHHHNLERD